MRKLASVEIIDKLEPIPNADRILKATVKGWECVVSKSDNFQQGDKVVYIEVDSVLPARPEFAFLKDRKYRIKTIKLRKQISQGLVLPLSYLPNKEYAVGEDVTKVLNITKFDPQLEAENKIMAVAAPKGRFTFLWKPLMRFRWFRRLYAKFHVQNEKFPTYIASKTDEERWQNITDKLEQWRDTNVPLICTEKVDGCSSTFFLDGGTFGVCSRNIWLRKEDNSPYWEIARRFQIEEALKDIQKCFGFRKIVLQGEIIGQNIQANKYKISGYDFYAYNLILDGIKVSQVKMEELLKEFRIKTVPVVYKHINVPSDLQTLNNLASGKSVLLDTQEREGIVCRNYEQGISFKAISPTFLLKEE